MTTVQVIEDGALESGGREQANWRYTCQDLVIHQTQWGQSPSHLRCLACTRGRITGLSLRENPKESMCVALDMLHVTCL